MHKRINLTIEEDTLAQIDEYANKLGLNRSSFVSMCCLEKIKNDKLMKDMPKYLKAIEKILDSNVK